MLKMLAIVLIVLFGLFLQVDLLLSRPDLTKIARIIWLILWNSCLALIIFGLILGV